MVRAVFISILWSSVYYNQLSFIRLKITLKNIGLLNSKKKKICLNNKTGSCAGLQCANLSKSCQMKRLCPCPFDSLMVNCDGFLFYSNVSSLNVTQLSGLRDCMYAVELIWVPISRQALIDQCCLCGCSKMAADTGYKLVNQLNGQ